MAIRPVWLASLVFTTVVVRASAPESGDLTRINPRFLVTVDEAQRWHAAKDAMGPAISGNASWKNFVGIIEQRIRAAGAVDVIKNAWTFERWQTTDYPDTSGWSLVSDGKPLRVASYGANLGSTPSDGVTAELVFNDPAAPPASLAGKIAVVQTVPETEKTPSSERVYEYPGDYMYLSNPETFPDPRIPTKVTRTVTMRAEMR